MYLTPDTDRSELASLSIAARGSQQRRQMLERLAGICTGPDVSVSVRFSEDEASCRPAGADSAADYVVVIPTDEIEQAVTDMAPRRWNKRVQVALLFHELGHVLYSDFEAFRERRREFDAEWRPLFREVYNAAEDGVVETQVAEEFNVHDDFLVFNETVAKRETARHREYVDLFVEADHTDVTRADMSLSYTVREALVVGILDRAVEDSGRFREIVDPEADGRVLHGDRRDALEAIRPEMDRYVADMLSEPDGTERVRIAAEFLRAIRPHLEAIPDDQLDKRKMTGTKPADADVDGDSPAVGDPREARLLPGSEAARRHVVTVAEGSSLPGQGDRDSREGHNTPPADVSREDVRRARERLSDDRVRGGDDTSAQEREAARLLGVVSADGNGLDRAGVAEAREGDGDRERWERARRTASRLAADLHGRLRRERRTRRQGGYRSGRLDSHRVVDAKRGSTRVFTRRNAGNEKDYSCLLILDRSRSMSDIIETAENAVAQLVHAFGSVGVDVSVVSVYEQIAYLELPFGADYEGYSAHLMTGRTGGSTPLSDVLTYARERVRTGDGHEPLVIVVTDGHPDSEDLYAEELAKCNFGVYGVYIADDEGRHANLFDHVVYSSPDGLDATLRTLVRNLMSSRC